MCERPGTPGTRAGPGDSRISGLYSGAMQDGAQTVAPEAFGLDGWLEFAGRLHPLALHLPIGLLAAVACAEAVARFRPEVRPLRTVLWAAFGVSAVGAAFTGWRLGMEGGHSESALELHRNLALGAAGAAVATSALAVIGRAPALRVLGLVACAGLFTLAGHQGGSLTHGARFLSDAAPPWLAPHVGPPPRGAVAPGPESGGAAGAPETVVEAAGPDEPPPIAAAVAAFRARCVECHGPDESKGKLRLDHAAGWLSQVDVETPADSELLFRITLPGDDFDAMPPEGEPRLAPEHVAAVRDWIERGAPADELGLPPGS